MKLLAGFALQTALTVASFSRGTPTLAGVLERGSQLAQATGAEASRGLRTDADFEYLNSVLEGISIPVDASKIEPFSFAFFGIGRFNVTWNEGANCGGLGLKNAAIAGSRSPDRDINGTVYQVFEVSLAIDSFEFSCNLPVNALIYVEGEIDPQYDTNVVYDSKGDLRITSTQNSQTMVTFAIEFFSPDFATTAPQFVRAKDQSCDDKFKTTELALSGQGFDCMDFACDKTEAPPGGSFGYNRCLLHVRPPCGDYLDTDAFVVPQLPTIELNETATVGMVVNKVVLDQLCALTGGLSETVADLGNGLVDLLNGLIESGNDESNVITTPDQVIAAVLAAEKELKKSMADTVSLVDLRNNSLISLLLDIVPEPEPAAPTTSKPSKAPTTRPTMRPTSLPPSDAPTEGRRLFEEAEDAALLPRGSGLGGLFGGGNKTITGEELFAALAGFLGIPYRQGQNALLLIIDFFLGTDLAATNGIVANLDLLQVAEAKFPGLLDILKLNLDIDNFGSIKLGIDFLEISTEAARDSNAAPFNVSLASGQSIVFPTAALGGVTLRGGLVVDLGISTSALLDIPIEYKVKEDFQVELTLQELVARAALLLPVDENEVMRLQLGPTLKTIFECLTSTFVEQPGLFTLLRLGDLGLSVRNVDDGLISLLSDLLNDLVTPLYGKVAGKALAGFARSFIKEQLGSFFTKGECPEIPSTPENLADVDLTTNELFLTIKKVLPLDDAGKLVELLVSAFKFPVKNNTVNLLAKPAKLLEWQLPQKDGPKLKLVIKNVLLGNLLPEPDVGKMVLLDVSPADKYYPRGLYNELQLFSPQRPLLLDLAASLNTISPTKNETNTIRVHLDVSNVTAIAEIFLAFSKLDLDGIRVQDIIDLNLDCFVAKLQRGGGLKTLALALEGVGLKLSCSPCDNTFISTWFERLEKPSSVLQIIDFLNDGLIPAFTNSITSPFEEARWAATVAKAKESCSGKSQPVGSPTKAPTAPQPPAQDQGATIALIGVFMFTLATAGALTCCCSFGTKTPSDVVLEAQVAEDSVKKEVRSSSSFGPATESASAVNEGAEELSTAALWRNPSVPAAVRVIIPVLLLGNFALFILGHVAVIIDSSAVGSVLGYEFAFEGFASLSVIRMVQTLWNGKAYLLALMIVSLSVVWPYVKVLSMALCWFLPAHRLSFRRRGSVLTLLDQLGKWSLVELFFVIQAMVLLQLKFQAPDTDILPEGIYELALLLETKYNLYTFTAALMCSLAISNVMVVYHERLSYRRLEVQRTAQGFAGEDLERVSMTDSLYEATDAKGVAYRVRLSLFGTVCFILSLFATVGWLVFASTQNTLRLEIYGLARNILSFGNQDSVRYISMFSFISDAFKDADAGRSFFAISFVLCAVVIPLLQLLSLAILPFKKFTLKGALVFYEVNMILCAWSALEVFVLSIAVIALELRTTGEFLTKDVCKGLQPLMENLLLPLGLTTELDVSYSCLGLLAFVETGAWIFVSALFLANLVHFFIVRLFKAYIQGRAHRHLRPTYKSNGLESHSDAQLSRGMKILTSIGLVQVTAPVSGGAVAPFA